MILSGTSAGGRGAYLHADWLQEQLPDAKVYAAPGAGLFFPNATDFDTWKAAGADPSAELGLLKNPGYWSDLSKGHLEEGPYKSYKPKACEDAHPPGTPLNPLCSVVGFYAPYIGVPLFPIEGQFDGTKPGNHGMPSLPKTGAISDDQSRCEIGRASDTQRTHAGRTPRAPPRAAQLPSSHRAHLRRRQLHRVLRAPCRAHHRGDPAEAGERRVRAVVLRSRCLLYTSPSPRDS